MFDADINTLLNVAITDALVDNHPDSGFCDVVDNACLAMVDFVGHPVESVSLVSLDASNFANRAGRVWRRTHPF